MLAWLAALPLRYSELKQGLSAATGASEDLLHVHFGLLIFVVVAVVFRRRMHSLWPVSLVWAFALTNELVDYFAPEWQVDTSVFDVLNSVFWPTMLFLVARRRRVNPPLNGYVESPSRR
jgi:hypothetical protein